jgi:Ser/Thr protein kinase RdoA (MazF antagonist)
MAPVSQEPAVPPHIAAAWDLAVETIGPLGTGLINRTFLARERGGEWRVLQQLNPLFPPEVNEDIEAVTTHLAARGLVTPRLVRTGSGALSVPDESGAWRLLTRIEGRVLDAMESPAQALSAGRLLGRFHRALDDLAHDFRHVRPPVHEPARHFADLARALAAHPRHPLYGEAAALADDIHAAAAALDPLPETPVRIVHGDPKISNLVFAAADDAAVCMLDLDTVGRMRLPFELGDAFRSWCNGATEDDPRGRFCAELFSAAVTGYASAVTGWITPAEAASVVAATATIQVELAARFCADILNERYFGWNPAQFGSRGAHNLARARGQLAVHRSLLAQRAVLERLAEAAFGRQV